MRIAKAKIIGCQHCSFVVSCLERVRYKRSPHSVTEIENGCKIPLIAKPPIFYTLLDFKAIWIILYFKLKDFVSDEIPMFHNVEFQEASGSEKRILEFFNQKDDRLLETDVSEESFMIL